MQPLKIFIGFDPVESVAWHTLVSSIMSQASVPVSIIPLNLRNLRDIHHRERDPKQSNEFTYIRFLVPYLCNYQGTALFMDCDMLLRTDIKELFSLADQQYAVQVVKHDYEPKHSIKYLGNVQHSYPRKNWSSVVLWNCGHPKNKEITPYKVDMADPSYLHRFNWLDDDEIGELPIGWNFLVSEYDADTINHNDIKNLHFTTGGPYFKEYETVDFAAEWFEACENMQRCAQLDD